MKEAMKAKSIGDKLYQLERIHSKLVDLCQIDEVLNEKNEKFESLFLNTILSLRKTIECFNNSRTSKSIIKYIKNIETILVVLQSGDKRNLLRNICNLHGSYIKFRRKNKKLISNSCEIDFQNICMPLYILNYKYKRSKNSQLFR